ncbi:MAG: hypothetical protein D6741_09645, partial [Planctomycetota bacterium]
YEDSTRQIDSVIHDACPSRWTPIAGRTATDGRTTRRNPSLQHALIEKRHPCPQEEIALRNRRLGMLTTQAPDAAGGFARRRKNR